MKNDKHKFLLALHIFYFFVYVIRMFVELGTDQNIFYKLLVITSLSFKCDIVLFNKDSK